MGKSGRRSVVYGGTGDGGFVNEVVVSIRALVREIGAFIECPSSDLQAVFWSVGRHIL